jgi:hypothetical protein
MKFDYGNTVQIKENAPIRYNPSGIGAICGITIIDNVELSEAVNIELGKMTYTVEFFDGFDFLVPEEYINIYNV